MNDYYINGPLLGIVTDNQDPDNLGRIKVMLSVMGDDVETDWIPMMSLYSSSGAGAFFLPEVDDQVVVAFMGDNPNSGVALGGIWDDNLLPPETGENSGSDLNKDGDNNLRFIKSRSEHMIILDDKSGDEKLQVILKDGKTRFEFLAKDKKISVKAEKGFVLKAKEGVGITAKECKFKVSKGLKIEGDGVTLESKGQDLKLKASNAVSIEGSQVKLN